MQKLWVKNLILIVLVALIAILPLIFVQGEFGGADGAAAEVLDNNGYESWADPLIEPKSGEIESLLFVAQAALGAGIIGFCIGRLTAKKPETAEAGS